jgi:hypothetical protein
MTITDRAKTHKTIAAHRGRTRLGIARHYAHTGWVCRVDNAAWWPRRTDINRVTGRSVDPAFAVVKTKREALALLESLR